MDEGFDDSISRDGNPLPSAANNAALNEAPGIGLTITEMKDILDEISVPVVDGRSNDRTVEIAKNLGAKLFAKMALARATP